MSDYARPQGFPYKFLGMNTRSRPDHMGPEKYPLAVNIRAASDTSVSTRPGYVPQFATAGNNAATITDIKSYTAIATDNKPRFLARDANQNIILDTGAIVTTQGNSNGYGASMLPFRPAASIQPWMYVAGSNDYQKISAPDANNNVSVYFAGLAEPAFAAAAGSYSVQAGINAPRYAVFYAPAANWTAGGNANASITDTTIFSENAGNSILPDPVVSSRLSVQVAKPFYIQGMLATVSANNYYPVLETWPAPGNTVINQSYYYGGSNGNCVMTAAHDIASSIGHGALVQLSGGGNNEVSLIQSATSSGSGTCAIDLSSNNIFGIGSNAAGIPTVVMNGTVFAGAPIAIQSISGAMTAGVATWAQVIANTGVFSQFALEDYIYVTLKLTAITAVSNVSVIFDVSSASGTFDGQTLTYSVDGTTLKSTEIAGDNETAGSVTVLHFPISALGGALSYCSGVKISITSSLAQNVYIGGLWVGSGSAPDIGDLGAPYQYRILARSTDTGTIGNASAPMRYGVSPRRESVSISLPSFNSTLPEPDPQADVWDIYRYGGSSTSYRYIGSGLPSTTFTDIYSDSAATAGSVLQSDNFQPWTSVGAPLTITGATISIVGTVIYVTGFSAWPAELNRWLPGTLILVDGATVFTLRARPYNVSGNNWAFFIEETAGRLTPSTIVIQEPIVGHQPNPYIIGPNDQGDFFAWGDYLRPGVLSFSKHYSPDSAPSTNNIELCAPSEPLVAGGLLGGIFFIGTSKGRWWAMYPSFTGSISYTQIERQIGRAPVSQYATCSDGKMIYFWAKDGICATDGGAAVDLTSADLWNIFPHEGIQGASPNRAPYIVPQIPPDYTEAAKFRLAVCDGYLYADYINIDGSQSTLVLDLSKAAWSIDAYANNISCHYSVEQPESTMRSAGTIYPMLLMGSDHGKVWKQQAVTNDNATPISGTMQTFEFNGGDLRAQPLFGDMFLDFISASNMNAQPTVDGLGFGNTTVVPGNANRQFVPISVGGQTQQKYMGLAVTWTNDFNSSNRATTLYAWQPSIEPQPEITTDRIGGWSNSLAGGN